MTLIPNSRYCKFPLTSINMDDGKGSLIKNIVFNRKPIVSILVVMLVICALPSISYSSSDDISVAASTDSPLTEAALHKSVVTLTLSGGTYARSIRDIRDAVSVSGIDGVTVRTFGVNRVSDTVVTVELEFNGNIDTDAVLTFTVGADAIAEYNGSPLTAQIPVTAIIETVAASTAFPLTEATLHESVVTLTLSGGTYDNNWNYISRSVTVSGIAGVTMSRFDIERISDTVVTVELEFDGNIDTDATLTFTVGADAIVGYNGPPLTAQIAVSANTEVADDTEVTIPVTGDSGDQQPEQPGNEGGTPTLSISTAAPLTETMLHESVVTLTLSGGTYERSRSRIRDAVEVSGIDGVTVGTFDIDRASDTEITIELEFNGNIDTDATLTFTVGADAIAEYNGSPLTAQIPVTAITESVVASTERPLTEATLHESVVTLTLSGRAYDIWNIGDAVAVSGIAGITTGWIILGSNTSNTQLIVRLEFDGSIDTDATLTFTVGADAIARYNGPALTAQIPVSATRSVIASTSAPLTEATLHESVVTLTLSGGTYEQADSDIRDAVAVLGIDGVTFGVERVSDMEITIELEFDGNINADATLTFTIGADAIAGYDGAPLTAQIVVTAKQPQTLTLEGHAELVTSVAFSPDGTLLASGSGDRTVKLWEVGSGQEKAILERHEKTVLSVAFSPDGTTLASAGGDGTVRLWDIESGQEKAALKGHEWVFSVAFSPDGTTLASGGDGPVHLWDVETNTNIATLEGHEKLVTGVAFSPDGTMLTSGSWDTVKLWDVETNVNIATLEGHTDGVLSVAFSPDGTTLALGSADNTVKLWDVESSQEKATLKGHTARVNSVAFSPDGTTLASGSTDNTVKLWDVESSQEKATLKGHTARVNSVAFSPDGTTLASGTEDGTVKLWDVSEWSDHLRLQTLVKVSGDDQEGMSGDALPNPLIVEVRDQDNNPLPDVQVIFTVTAGYGTLSEQSTIEYATTDANGQAEAILTLGPFAGTNTVEVSLGLRTLATFNAVGVGMPTPRSMEGDYRTWRLPDDAIIRLGKGAIGRGDRAVAFSPDSTRLAVVSAIGIWLYDVATGTEVALLGGHTGGVTSVAFSSDGTLLASGSQDETVKLWAVATHTNIATLRGHTDGVWSVAFSPDGKMLASGAGDPGVRFPADNTVKLWDMETNANIATLEGHEGRVASVAFSPDGQILASGSDDETIKLWDVETNTNIATLEGHTDRVASVAFSPDGKMLASAGGTFDETVKLWDVETNTNIATLEGHADGVASVAFSPDGKILASGVGDAFFPEFFPESSDNRVKLWDVASGEPIASLGGHTGEVWSVAFSPDGTMLASAGGTFDNTVKLWDVDSAEPTATLKGHTDVVSSVTFLFDGTRLAAKSGITILLWDVDTGDQITIPEGHALSPDGTRLAVVSEEDGTILVWDVDTGEQITSLERHENYWVNSETFSPDGTRLASGAGALDGTMLLLLWDVDSGELIATLEGHENYWVNSETFSPDGTTLASRIWDGTILLWDVDSGELITSLEGHTGGILRLRGFSALAFSPDGATLASGARDGTILLWDMETKEIIATLEGYAEWVNLVSFSPDGAILASGSGNTILLWDMETKEIIATLEGHAGWVNSVSFSPDGATLASGAGDGTILLWNVAEWTNPSAAVAANKLIGLPDELQLQQNAPNPFNSETVISYFLPKSGPVHLEVFSVIGQRVAVLRQGPQQAGYHQLHWNGRDREGRSLASGMYLYRLVTDEGILTHKLTLLR